MSTPSPVSFKNLEPYDHSTLDARAKLTLVCEGVECSPGQFVTYNYVSGGLISEGVGQLAPSRYTAIHPAETNADVDDFFGSVAAASSPDFFESYQAGLQELVGWVDLGSYFWWPASYQETQLGFTGSPLADYFNAAAVPTPQDFFSSVSPLAALDMFTQQVPLSAATDAFSGTNITGTIWDNGATVWDNSNTLWDL